MWKGVDFDEELDIAVPKRRSGQIVSKKQARSLHDTQGNEKLEKLEPRQDAKDINIEEAAQQIEDRFNPIKPEGCFDKEIEKGK